MKKLKIFIPLCICLSYHISAFGARSFDHTITIFIRQYPELITIDEARLPKAAAKPSISRKILKSLCPGSNQGIISLYSGFVGVSDFDGQITFPRMHQKASFIFLITKHIKPIMMLGNTIHHWELIPNNPIKAYSVNQEQDKQTKLFYWDVKESTPPHNNIIPLNAIILFVNPSKIVIPEGITITNKSPNLVLPQIYATKDIKSTRNALIFLQMRAFYGPLHSTTKKVSPTYYSSKLMN